MLSAQELMKNEMRIMRENGLSFDQIREEFSKLDSDYFEKKSKLNPINELVGLMGGNSKSKVTKKVVNHDKELGVTFTHKFY